MKRVLIITYYWPPNGGGGVHRWLKMSKYLPEYGWQPVIYTPENPEIVAYDPESAQQIHPDTEVIKSKVWEPYDLYKKLTGRKKNANMYSGFIQEKGKSKWLQKLAVFIRGNFFIPDARRFWIGSGADFLSDYLQKNPVNAIISTGPPHSTHMIALRVHKKFPQIPWVADFRDPWTKIDFYQKLNLTWLADYQHKKKERQVILGCTHLVTVSPRWLKDFGAIKAPDQCTLITNGYDHADFEHEQKTRSTDPHKIIIRHLGSMNEDRNPIVLFQALQQLCHEDPALYDRLALSFVGQVDVSILDAIAKYGLMDKVEIMKFVPHRTAIHLMLDSDILLLCINNADNKSGILPGKMYEYMGAQRAILCIGPSEGDVYEILTKVQPNAMVSYDDVETAKNFLQHIAKQKDQSPSELRYGDFSMYARKNLAGAYGRLLEKLIVSHK